MAVQLQKIPKILLDIQECVTALKNECKDTLNPINDDNPLLHKFCMKLESLLLYDINKKVSLLGNKKTFWDYLGKCLSSRQKTHDGIRFVRHLSEIHTSEGRGRAFVRFCLMHQCLADSIQRCTMNEKLTREWYGEKSPLQNKEHSSFLLSVLYELNECEFDLSPHDRDLDIAWPKYASKVTGSQFSWKPPSRSVSISSLSSSLSLHDSLHPADSSITSGPSVSDSMEIAQESLDDIEIQKKSLKDMTEQHEELQIEYKQLQEKFDNREKHLHEQIDKLKTELCDSQKTIDQLSAVDDEHNIRSCEGKDYQIVVGLLQKELNALHVETKELRDHLESFKSTQHLDQTSMSEVQKIQEHLLTLHNSVDSISNSMPTNATALADENNNLKQQVTFLQTDNLELNKQIVALRSEFNIYKAYPQLEEQVSALKDALTTCKKMISLKDMKITKLQSDLLKHKPNASGSKQLLSEASTAQLNIVFPAPSDKNSDQYLLYEQVQDLFTHLESTETEKAMLLSIVKVAAGIQKSLEDKVCEKDEQLSVTEKQMKEMNGKMIKMLALVDEQQKQYGLVRSNLSAAQAENKNLTKQMSLLNELLQQADKTDVEVSVEKEIIQGPVVVVDSASAQCCSVAPSGSNVNKISNEEVVVSPTVPAKVNELEKPDQPGIVLKVNRTLSKLNSLIEEKMELQQELESTKVVTSSLMHKVADQEHRLSTVTMELSQSQDLISKMKTALSSLQTNESIMRYELKEKRHFLNKLKAQLESSRAQWKQVCKTNAESEIEWQSLRQEFSQRHKQGSEESGYSDENCKVETVASDATLSEKLAETPPTETDSSDIVSPDDSSPLIEGFPLEDDELDPRDRRLKFLEEQCRLLCRKLLSNSKYGAALDMRLTSLLGHHGSPDIEDTTAAPEDQEISETSEMELTNEASTPGESGDHHHQLAPQDDVKNDDDVTNDSSLKLCHPEVAESASDDVTLPIDSVVKPATFVLAQSLPKRVEKLRKEKEDLQQELDKISNTLQLAEAREVHLNAQIQLYQVEKDETLKKLELAQQKISDLVATDKSAEEENDASHRYQEVMTTKNVLQSKLESIEERLQHKSAAMVDMETTLTKSQQELTLTKQTFEQELSALKFQMNTQSLKHQQAVKEHEQQQVDLISTKNCINEQEKTILYLEMELTNVKDSYEKEKDHLWNQLGEVKMLLEKRNEENQVFQEQLGEKSTELLVEKELVKQLKVELESRIGYHETSQHRMREEIQQLQSDNDELRKRIMQLLKDKDVLWKCSTQFNQLKSSSPAKSPDDKAAQCAKCNSEFGLLLRKHHCRVCERIFCYYCCCNWMLLPSLSSDKIRVCDYCCQRTATENESAVAINSYINSVYSSSDIDDDLQDNSFCNMSSQTLLQSSPYSVQDTSTDNSSAEGEVSNGAVGTINSETLLPSVTECTWKNVTLWSMEETPLETLKVVTLTILAGQKYGVPLAVEELKKNILWNFTSHAKNIGFSVLYCKSLSEKLDTTEIISPMMMCDAHLAPVNGKLQPKKTGVYILLFDNTHSRLTSKTLEVSFMLEIVMSEEKVQD